MNISAIGRALGRRGAGCRKTMTPAALKQRRDAAKISAKKRKGRKRSNNGNATVGTTNASATAK